MPGRMPGPRPETHAAAKHGRIQDPLLKEGDHADASDSAHIPTGQHCRSSASFQIPPALRGRGPERDAWIGNGPGCGTPRCGVSGWTIDGGAPMRASRSNEPCKEANVGRGGRPNCAEKSWTTPVAEPGRCVASVIRIVYHMLTHAGVHRDLSIHRLSRERRFTAYAEGRVAAVVQC